MKIVTWNVNGYRSIVGQNPSRRYDKITQNNKLFDFVERIQPTILCIQEVKADVEQIQPELICPEGFFHFYNTCKTKKGYSGVAVFSKIQPKNILYGIGIDEFDAEGRFIELDFDSFILLNIYFPKGYTDHERLDFKLEFYDAIYDYLRKLKERYNKVVVSGDYNTAHKEIDLARPKENINTSGFLPIERQKLDELVEMGFKDTFRMFVSEGGHYSWWSQRGRARENNVGWRVDYHFVSNEMARFVQNCYMLSQESGSDHCPVVLELNKNLLDNK